MLTNDSMGLRKLKTMSIVRGRFKTGALLPVSDRFKSGASGLRRPTAAMF